MLARVQVNRPILRTYTIVLEPDEESGVFTVTVPLLPGCITEGADCQEALAMAAEAIGLVLESMASGNEPLPEEMQPPELATLTLARARAMASAMA